MQPAAMTPPPGTPIGMSPAPQASGLQQNMNLAAVRTRAEELRSSIDSLVLMLRYEAHRLQWEEVLKRYSVINVQVLSLKDQLRAMLKQFVVHPKLVDSADMARVLPIQLSTSLLPEMLSHDMAALAGAEVALLAAGTAAGRPVDAGPLTTEERYEGAINHIDSFNALIDSLTLSGGVLDPKGISRGAITKASQQLASTLSTVQQMGPMAAAAASGGAPGAPAPSSSLAKRKAPEGPMEPLLVQYLTGEGLRGRRDSRV